MANFNDAIGSALDRAGAAGLSTRHLAEALALGETPENLGAIELLCVLSSDLRAAEGTWHATRAGKTAAVLAALENYVAATGKRVFRGASAMHGLAAEILPTQEELVQIVESSNGRFGLLPNEMLKCYW